MKFDYKIGDDNIDCRETYLQAYSNVYKKLARLLSKDASKQPLKNKVYILPGSLGYSYVVNNHMVHQEVQEYYFGHSDFSDK